MNIRAFAILAATLPAGASQAATIFLDVGATPGDIDDEVTAFEDALGELNPFLPQNFAGGRRDVNWDGVPDAISDDGDPDAISDAERFPGDFFNAAVPGRARGIAFAPTGDAVALQVSASFASGVPVEFAEEEIYTVFSPEKLFRTLGGQTLDILFFDPSDQVTKARTLGFGAVFTGIATADGPTVTFYGPGDRVLATQEANIPVDEGLAFIGATFDAPLLERVSINLGEDSVMDDFIFGEPAPIPLPAGVWLLGGALAGLAALRRRA